MYFEFGGMFGRNGAVVFEKLIYIEYILLVFLFAKTENVKNEKLKSSFHLLLESPL